MKYEVKRILDNAERHVNGAEGSERTQRKRGKSKQLRDFLVKWRGYRPEHNTWEPESNIAKCVKSCRSTGSRQGLEVGELLCLGSPGAAPSGMFLWRH